MKWKLSVVAWGVFAMVGSAEPKSTTKPGPVKPSTNLSPYEKQCSVLAREKLDPGTKLHRLFKITWEYELGEGPEFATYLGRREYNRKWTDLSLDAIERRKREDNAPLDVLKTIPRIRLTPKDQLNYDLFKKEFEESIEAKHFFAELLPVDQLDNPATSVPELLENMPAETTADYEDILARLNALPVNLQQVLTLLKEGVAKQVTIPTITTRDIPKQFETLLTENFDKNPLFRPFLQMPSGVSPADQARLSGEAKLTLKNKVIPAFRELHTYLTQQYIPKSRGSVAWSSLPKGKEWYEMRVRHQTTTVLTPKQVHEIGLAEVKRIRGEMERVMKLAKFGGTIPEFFEYLREEKKFYYEKAEDLLAGYRDIAKRIDPGLPVLFGKLPRLTYGVKAMPDYSAGNDTSGKYHMGSYANGRPAYFMANTSHLEARPKWDMEALVLHEAVPGHHLQIALAQEQGDLPEFRREGGYTAFQEGWALYAESLGERFGLYEDPYSKFGQLTAEMWRAVRLVVDTGLHAFGWTREQAIQYFKENTGKPETLAVIEIDRYINWAGQALAYKIGELKIKQLREGAQKTLGKTFDIRSFHDTVLENGAVPLSILETKVKEWEQRRLKSKN